MEPARVESMWAPLSLPSQGYTLSISLDFSFSRPPEPELGGGLTHPTTVVGEALLPQYAPRRVGPV